MRRKPVINIKIPLFFIAIVLSNFIIAQPNTFDYEEKTMDTVYIYYDSKSIRQFKNYLLIQSELDNFIEVTIQYKIRPHSFWLSTEQVEKEGGLKGDTYHQSFQLKYNMSFMEKNVLKSKKDISSVNILNWNEANSESEQKRIINLLKNANVIYLVPVEESYQVFLREVQFKI